MERSGNSGNADRLHRISFGILKYTECPKHRGSIKNMARSKGVQLLAGAFHVIMNKIEADIFQTVKKWN